MANAYVQGDWDGNAASATTLPYASGLTVTTGNTIILASRWDDGAITATVADNFGNTYTSPTNAGPLSSGDAPVFRLQVWVAKNITGGANYTPTVTYSVATTHRALAFHEVSGANTTAPADVAAIAALVTPGTGADGATSGSNTTTANGDYIFGALAFSTSPGTVGAGTNFTMRLPPDTSGFSESVIGTEDRIQTSAGSVAATFTEPVSQSTVIVMVAIKAAGAGGAFSLAVDGSSYAVTGADTTLVPQAIQTWLRVGR